MGPNQADIWSLLKPHPNPLLPGPDPGGQCEDCQAPSETSADMRNAFGQLWAETQGSEQGQEAPRADPVYEGPAPQ